MKNELNKTIDTNELDQILDILENFEDEALAAKLLNKFNDKSKVLGQLLLNKDPKLNHESWKKMCTQAKSELDAVLKEILKHKL